MTDNRPCPYKGCPIESEKCPSEYKDQCIYQAQVTLDVTRLHNHLREMDERAKDETGNP